MIDSASPNELASRLDRLERRLDLLVADLAAGVEPATVAKRQAELQALLEDIDRPGG